VHRTNVAYCCRRRTLRDLRVSALVTIREPCKNGCTDGNGVSVADTCVSEEPSRISWVCTSAPPGEFAGMIRAAAVAVPADATVAVV